MIVGRFVNTTGRPYVGGRLLLPRLRLSTNLSFLVDTGADISTLMPADGLKMGIDYGSLISSTVVGGMGGYSECFQESAVLGFDEPNRNLLRYYFITLLIPKAQPDLMKLPPILGRDVLDRWHMAYDPSRGTLKFTVRSADHTARANEA